MKTKLDKLIRFALLAPFVAALLIYGSTKPTPGPVFAFDNTYIGDGGSYATNDTVHVALTRRIMELPIDDCNVIAYMRERGSTNAADYVMLPTYTFGEYPVDFEVANATNYNYWFYLDYVPPSPVHTNGVFELRGFEVAGEPRVPNPIFSAGFAQSVSKILPLTAADYIQDGLVAMWDGIENAGWGVHDPDATVWKDLTGNGYDMTIHAGSTIGDDYIAHATQWVAGIGGSKSIPFTACEAVFLFRQGVSSIACVGRSSDRNNYTYIQANGAARIGISQRGYNTNNYAGFDVPENLAGARCSVSVNYSFGKYFGAKEAYLNSAPVTIAFGNVYPYNNAGNAFAVGGRYQGGAYPTAIPTGANVCNIRLYSRALTADEIAHNYNIDKERFNLP